MFKKSALVISLALLLSACSAQPAQTQQNSNTQTPATGQVQTANTITIQSFAFSPNTLNVSAGQTITVINNDSAPHTVTSDDGKFDVQNLDPGKTGSFVAPPAGTYTYHCNIHRSMTGTLVVK